MGCAGSTPMIATAGSEMLKAATHVASDAAKSAENAVEDVAETVGKTLDSAKESVGTAVTGIAHDLGNVLTDKSTELDTAKNQLLERLHLGGATKAIEHSSEATTNQLDITALEAAARAPTPPPDLDSLKTSTPEPEIEQAMANSHADTPPTPKPTIAELEKLTAEMKQTTQATAAAVTAVTEGIAETKNAMWEAPTGTTAATEPAVDIVAWLAAEKRPGTTEWEKHADHLTKTRKMNEFKGGGKFRRFGPPVPPPNFTKPTENVHLKRALLEDDSCYSDAYYNSHSSPTNSDSPRLRRARLPINGVLATNAKRMQREFATFVSNRRSPAGALRSLTVSPALARRFNYHPERVRITSPTNSILVYTRASYGTQGIVAPELLLPNSSTANWQRGLASAHLMSPHADVVRRVPKAIAARLDSPLAANAMNQTKVNLTRGFAPPKGESTGRSKIIGQTRSGSPVNRRVFARRSVSPRVNKARAINARSGSPERTRALVQEKVEAGRKRQPVTQTPTTIKLEREASIKEGKKSTARDLAENGFTLSKALSPIKIVAESHYLPHLKSTEHKALKNTAYSMLEVVEQAVAHAKNGGLTENDKNAIKQRALGDEARKPTIITNKAEKQSDYKKKVEIENAERKKNNKSENSQARNDSKTDDASINRNQKPTPSPMRGSSTSRSTIDSIEMGEVELPQNITTPYRIMNKSTNANFEVNGAKGRFSMSPKKRNTLNYIDNEKQHNNWGRSSSQHSEHSNNYSPNRDGLSSSSIQRDGRHKDVNKATIEKINKNNCNNSKNQSSFSENNWTSLGRRKGTVKYTVNSNRRFEDYVDPSFARKEDIDSPIKQSPCRKNDLSIGILKEREKSLSMIHNPITNLQMQRITNNSRNHEISTQAYIGNKKRSSNNSEKSKAEGRKIIEPEKVSSNCSFDHKPIHSKNLHRIENNPKLQCSANLEGGRVEGSFANDNPNINHTNHQRSPRTNNPTHLSNTVSSPCHNSHNNSPSRSSMSSTSIVIGTIFTTPETENGSEVTPSIELSKTLNKFEQLRDPVDEECVSATSCSGEENSQNDLEDSLHTEHEDSSRTEYEETIHTDMELEQSLSTDVDIYSASSLDDLINRLPPQTAYLNLGRSATMLTLRSSNRPIFDVIPSYRSTPHGSPYKQHHTYYSSSCDSDQLEKVPFVVEFSSVAPSRSPQVPASPYKIRARCAVCYDRYVIK